MNNTIGYIICETDTGSDKYEQTILNIENDKPEIEAVLQAANSLNRNTRYYKDTELFPELTSERTTELIKTGNMYGEAGHPMSTDLVRQQTIDPKNISHRINKLWTKDNLVMAHITPASTTVGDDFGRVVLDNTKVSFSLRALGSLKETKLGSEVENIRLITYDWVIFPSHKEAYMKSIVNLKESTLLNKTSNLVLRENDMGICVPFNNKEVTEYIKDKSVNVKKVIESLEILYKDIMVNENGTQVTLIDNDNNKIVVFLESYIKNELRNYCEGIHNKRMCS